MNSSNKKTTTHQSPPKAELTIGSPDAELWMDICLAAIAGFGGSTWSRDGKTHSAPSSTTLTAMACETADGVLAEYKARLKVAREGT